MAGQSYVGHVGDSTHAFTQQAIIEKTIDRLSRRSSLVGGFTTGADGNDSLVKTTTEVGEEVDISNTSVIQTKEITVGDEARFSLVEDLGGMPTHGNQPVRQGDYLKFKHDLVRVNMFDTPEYQFLGEMDQQRFATLMGNMEPEMQTQLANYMAVWNDVSLIQSLLCGADRGLLNSSDGGLNMTLMNAPSAGYCISCKNTYVGGHGMVTWNDTRATYEAAIGTEIYDLEDASSYGFSLTSHEIILNQLTSVLRFKETQYRGKTLRSICLIDPWLLKRLMVRNTNNTWYNLIKDADLRGPANRMIERDNPIMIDGVLYIPCDWLRAFRATGEDGAQPTYGASITSDPQTYIATADATSKKCCAIYLGAKAVLHAQTRKVYGAGSNAKKGGRFWITPRYGDHGKGGGWAGHTKFGFKRYEPEAKDGRTAYHNDTSLVAWFYDPGPGVSFAA